MINLIVYSLTALVTATACFSQSVAQDAKLTVARELVDAAGSRAKLEMLIDFTAAKTAQKIKLDESKTSS
ncbi:MAG: hypothetical protein SGJ17_08620 [Hyphomicrobiales bacterium]|nr:hypothetical protein [Hyphomicrobiales bacterium]